MTLTSEHDIHCSVTSDDNSCDNSSDACASPDTSQNDTDSKDLLEQVSQGEGLCVTKDIQIEKMNS